MAGVIISTGSLCLRVLMCRHRELWESWVISTDEKQMAAEVQEDDTALAVSMLACAALQLTPFLCRSCVLNARKSRTLNSAETKYTCIRTRLKL